MSKINQDRINVVKASKHKMVNSLKPVDLNLSQIDKLYFRAQERLRYFSLPHCPFSYVTKFYKHFVNTVFKIDNKIKMMVQTYKYYEYQKQIPSCITKIVLVLDACARLPGRFGTKEDIYELCGDSHFFN